MANRINSMLKNVKEKALLTKYAISRTVTDTKNEKVTQLMTKYASVANVQNMKERFKNENVYKKVQDAVSQYEKFTGVEEIMALQQTVVSAQERFMTSQERRRDLGRELASIRTRLQDLHAEMQNTMKGDEKYLRLCTEEHKLIVQERAVKAHFAEAEREERELFAAMSSAVKVSHERERAHAERNKYWYIVASVMGTILGIAGSTINNRLKMAEFRQLMEEQMARSAGVLYTVAGGNAGQTSSSDTITQAMKTEFAYQENLAQSMKIMQDTITTLVTKQSNLIEHLRHYEHTVDVQLKDLRRIIIAASKASAQSDADLALALASVHHDDQEISYKPILEEELAQPMKQQNESVKNEQIISALGVIACVILILGGIFGKLGGG